MLLAASLIWGFGFVAQRAGMDHVGPFTFNASRFFLGSCALVPVLLLTRNNRSLRARLRPSNLKTLILGGCLGGLALFLASSFQQIGIVYISLCSALSLVFAVPTEDIVISSIQGAMKKRLKIFSFLPGCHQEILLNNTRRRWPFGFKYLLIPSVSLSPSGRYLIDTYSTPVVPAVSVLLNADGRKLLTLEEADISRLIAKGWQPPIPIKVKARDCQNELR